ncbi:MAG: hypothetical protein KBE09_05060 [Candidatus Pacebacteria bacterium]|nr:hypothetical protein [Candidatus Paceibacterota bacterium]
MSDPKSDLPEDPGITRAEDPVQCEAAKKRACFGAGLKPTMSMHASRVAGTTRRELFTTPPQEFRGEVSDGRRNPS